MTSWAIASFRQHHWPWLQHVNVKGQWHSQFSPNASHEKCTMGRVLSMIKYYYNSGKYVTLTFDIWPWPLCLTLRLIYCYIVLWRQKNKCLTSRDAKTVLRSLYRRQQSWSVFPQGTWCAQREVSTTSGSKVMTQKVIFLVLDMFDLDLDISRSFDFWEFAFGSPAWLIEAICSLIAEI